MPKYSTPKKKAPKKKKTTTKLPRALSGGAVGSTVNKIKKRRERLKNI